MDMGQGFMAPLSVGKKQYIFFSLFGVSSGGVPSPGIVEGKGQRHVAFLHLCCAAHVGFAGCPWVGAVLSCPRCLSIAS